MTVPEYRRDGWPLCPACGEDELADLSVRDWPASFKADPASELTCYVCHWQGTLPLRAVAPVAAPNTPAQEPS